MEAVPRAATSRGNTAMFAMVRTKGRTIAIPSEFVTQAVEAPPELAQVPRRACAIEGVITVGRRLVPVIGLTRWLESAADSDHAGTGVVERTNGQVLLLTAGNTCIGLAVDTVVGAQRIRLDQVQRLFHDVDPDELFQSAALFDDDSVPTSILEPGRLMALAGVWVADAVLDGHGASGTNEATAVGDQTSQAAAHAHTAQGVAHATFRIANATFALPASNIGELLHRPRLRNELLAYDGVLGLCDWRGRVVPVVDLTVALNALPSGDDPAWLCIVCEGELAIGVVVHEVLDIAKIAPEEGAPEHAPPSERSVVGRRLVSGERLLQVIDMAALLRRYDETAISSKGLQPERLRATADRTAPAYMVFDAGGMFAAQIDGVQEVVPLPDALRLLLHAGISATLHWREEPVPVMAIADNLVTMAPQAARQLVIIRWEERLAALPIAAVKGMVPRGVACRNRIRMQGRPVDLISVDTDGHCASYPVVDLRAALQLAART